MTGSTTKAQAEQPAASSDTEPHAASAPLPAQAGQTSAQTPWPVRHLSEKVAHYLGRMPPVWVEGQLISMVRRPGSSIAFLTLRDSDADASLPITAPIALLDALPTPLAEGARVVIHARATYWAKRGSLQWSAREIRPVGLGELLAQLERLKVALTAEGLFDPARKIPLPFLPERIGLICGRASAAERDVTDNAQRRWPASQFTIREVAVQGPTAAKQVTAALIELDQDPQVSVIVITRGGGSLEDLLPFSNEALIRAVAAASTPIISAIGHEVDTPLLDLVADVRASTPTDAARLLVPDLAEQQAILETARTRLRHTWATQLRREQQGLDAVRTRPALAAPHMMLLGREQELSAATQRGRLALTGTIDRAADQLSHLRAQVRALSPAATLDRGYAVVQGPRGEIIRNPDQAPARTKLRIRLAEGELTANATRPAAAR